MIPPRPEAGQVRVLRASAMLACPRCGCNHWRPDLLALCVSCRLKAWHERKAAREARR